MTKFARDILQKMNVLTKELEVQLGPDTGDLKLRVGKLPLVHQVISILVVLTLLLLVNVPGLHSGPVTAGVLRGERARFQLFGDVSYKGWG